MATTGNISTVVPQEQGAPQVPVIISFDIEAVGSGYANMNQFGASASIRSDDAASHHYTEVGKFQRAIQTTGVPDECTMREFWGQGVAPEDRSERQAKNAAHFEHCRSIQVSLEEFVRDFLAWCEDLSAQYGGKLTFVAKPAAYDWQYLNGAVQHYFAQYPTQYKRWWGFKATCISTMMDVLSTIHGQNVEKMMNPPAELRLTHNALDDAMLQGFYYHRCVSISQQIAEELADLRESSLLLGQVLATAQQPTQ